MDIQSITNPHVFVSFMETVWDAPCTPNPDGGMTMYQHPKYDRYHNAAKIARELGLRITGNTGDWYVFRWPDGQGVRVKRDGSAITIASHYGRKPRKQG